MRVIHYFLIVAASIIEIRFVNFILDSLVKLVNSKMD